MGSKKKKKRCKQITSRSPRTMSGLVRQPDNCPIGLIIFFFFFARSRFLAHNAYQPLFKKKKKKREKKEKWIILFSVSGSSQRSSVFITSCHLPLASFLSPSAASVSLLH
jgi:hypothetical protein